MPKHFISVQEAQRIVRDEATRAPIELCSLHRASHRVLAKDVKASIDLPPFVQSSVDGYAFHHGDLATTSTFRLVGESSAGKSFAGKLGRCECVRIFTGAEAPTGADCIVMQEDVECENDTVRLRLPFPEHYAMMRMKGSHLRKSSLALAKGSTLTPGAIGLLASLGYAQVAVFQQPRVSIIVSGNELQTAPKALRASQVYESNIASLRAALKEQHISKVRSFKAADSAADIRRCFTAAMDESDYILLCGGISVGEYDYVETVLRSEKVKECFYKVRQRPGKPLYYGRKKTKHIFALPGNPASVLSCFYEYVLPSLRLFQGFENCALQELRLPLTQAISKSTSLTHFVRARTDFKSVTALTGQESYKMLSYAEANCLIVLPENVRHLDANELVDVHLLPT